MASPTVTRSRRPAATIESDDAFAMRAAELGEWAKRNIRRIMMVAGVAAALLVAAMAYFLWQQSRAAEASAEFLKVTASAAPAQQRIPQLERFVAQYGGSEEAQEARLELASLYLDTNQPARAVPHAREVAGSRGALRYQGQMMLGAALSRSGNRAGALAAYRDASTTTELDFQRAEALTQAALLEEGAGNWQASAELYRQILADTKEGSLDRSVIEMRIAEVEGHLAGARR